MPYSMSCLKALIVSSVQEFIALYSFFAVDQDKVVGISTHYGLDILGIESWWGEGFSTPVQTDPGAHPASSVPGLSRG